MIGAVDIGGTKIAVGMVSEEGVVLAQRACPTGPERGPADGLRRIVQILKETASQAGDTLRGIGIGCTGPVDPFSGRVGNVDFLPGWEGTDLVGNLQSVFNVSVALENDADAAALGEAAWGAGRGALRFIFITISTGIGGGIVFDGKLYRGVAGAHPEVGHHVIDPSGPACSCGFNGCWESLASGPALARWYNGNIPTGSAALDARQVCTAAEHGDPYAMQAVGREARYLGLGLANLINLFTPDVIALGGGLMHSQHLFWGTIQSILQTGCRFVPVEKTRLVLAEMKAEAGLTGAARAWMQRFM